MHQPPRRGYLTLKIGGLPVLLHWSFPAVGASTGLFAVQTAGQLAVPVFLWSSLACAVLIVLHEAGHAAAAWSMGLRVHRVTFTGAGGWCYTDTPPRSGARLFLYSAGALAQLALLAVTVLLLALFGAPAYLPLNCAVVIFTVMNVLMLIVNLVPRGRNDGALMAQALRELQAARRARRSLRR